jgi:hypothetical protein
MTATGRCHQVHRRRGAQCAADTVKVTRHQIDQLHQPMTQRAEYLGRHAHAPVAHSLVRCSKVPCQLADLFGRHRTLAAHGLGGKPGDGKTHLLKAFNG